MRISAINLTLSIIIVMLFITIAYIYKLNIDVEFLKEDMHKLKYPTNDSDKNL